MRVYHNLAPTRAIVRSEPKKKRQDRSERNRKLFEEHLNSTNWRELVSPMDVVIFFRECYKRVNGKESARTSIARWMKVAKNMLQDYGAGETLHIICCSFYCDPSPVDMGWYQTWHLSDMLKPERYEYLKHEASALTHYMTDTYMSEVN